MPPASTTTSTAKPLKSVAKPKSTTGESKVLPKKKIIAPEIKKAQSAGDKKPEPAYNYGDNSIRVYAGPTKTVAAATSKVYAATNSVHPPTNPSKTTQPKPKAPIDAPIQIKKKPLDKRPVVHDYRSVSTSTTTSNASTASTLSTISSASSVSSTSAMSTETIKASKNIKPKVVPAPKPLTKTQEGPVKVIIPPKKTAGEKVLPVKQKKDIIAKPTTTKIVGQTSKLAGPEKSKGPLPKKVQPVTKQSSLAADASRPAMQIPAKPARVVPKTIQSVEAPAAAPLVKKTALKPKPVAKLAAQDSSLLSDSSSSAPARKMTGPLPPVLEVGETKTPGGKKSKIIKPSGTVKKIAMKPTAIATTVPAPPAAKPISAAATAARTAASTPAKAAANPASRRIVSAPVPPTPKSVKPQKVASISTTPAPIRTLRPHTERPSARRKSVSFRSPLEAFQIIPARRASASPPKSSSRRHSIARSVASSEAPSTRTIPTPVLESSPLPQVLEESVSRSPPAPTVEDCDDDDLVFQDYEDDFDVMALGVITANKPASIAEEPKAEAEAEAQTEAEKLDEGNPADDIAEDEQPGEPADESISRPPRPQTPWAPVAEDEDDIEDDRPAFELSEHLPTDTEELDADPEIDDSTVFYDVDESYIPQYSSPRKPGTPRSRLNTPGSARHTKPGKELRLMDSPKLDLLKLSSPAKRKKMGKVKTRSAPDLRAGLGVKSPLGEEVVV